MAFKVLFQVDQVRTEPDFAMTYLLKEQPLVEKDRDFALTLIQGAITNQEAIDKIITGFSRDWDLTRMSAIDRNIMRLAGYEILFMQPSEPVVAIDEAVEIAKKYGDENSPGFINAILDKMLGDHDDSVSGN